ncbi:MAG TPA: sensor histidine kinase [Gemmatimonadales bacterium]|nr:sensor histidine kinase [Gemmatimonadales bacterium]
MEGHGSSVVRPYLHKLADLLDRERENVLAEWIRQVRRLPSAAHLDTPTLQDHVPEFLDELAQALRDASDEVAVDNVLQQSPPAHGRHRFEVGFDIVEVVGEYSILRGVIQDLAEGQGITLSGSARRIVNRVFDQAIGIAVQTFATQQAVHLQRRRDEHVAFVAHDLRTPLQAISLNAETLMRDQLGRNPSADSVQALKSLRRNSRRLQELVEQVLKESDGGTEAGVKVEPREFDLWPVVESVLHDLQPVAEGARTTLRNEVPDELIAYGDATLVRRVLQNLISNAINFTPRGRVTIGARRTGTDETEVWVQDTGPGIPRDRLATIFERRLRDSAQSPVNGLGLRVVKSLVEAQGGRVTVESKEGIGSTFRFTLPGKAIADHKEGGSRVGLPTNTP